MSKMRGQNCSSGSDTGFLSFALVLTGKGGRMYLTRQCVRKARKTVLLLDNQKLHGNHKVLPCAGFFYIKT